MKFYASTVFFFYSHVHAMWISVMLVGVFQTIITIPIRIIQLQKAKDIEQLEDEIEDAKGHGDQYIVFKKKMIKGNKNALFYSVNFYIQLVAYMSIGRLFLTDFYSKPLDPKLLFSFVEYPAYPIQNVIYRFPYLAPHHFIDYGLVYVIIAWALIIIFKILSRGLIERYGFDDGLHSLDDTKLNPIIKVYFKLFSDYSLFLLLASYLLIRYFPVDWHIAWFVGDVGVQNTRLNTITAITTTITVIWLNRGPIKTKIAELATTGLSKKVLEKTQISMWKETFRNAILIGLGAFFLTNQIPSAFELSIFVFEIISWTSPFILDPIVKRLTEKTVKAKEK